MSRLSNPKRILFLLPRFIVHRILRLILENYLNELDKQNKELIITGDLNFDLSVGDLQPHSRRLMDIFRIQLFQLKQ